MFHGTTWYSLYSIEENGFYGTSGTIAPTAQGAKGVFLLEQIKHAVLETDSGVSIVPFDR